MASTTAGSDDENEMGDDVAVDYRLLAKLGKKKDKDGQIVIPKRGEKDFEPLEKGANVQERALRDGREAMFGALEGLRGGNFKTISHAWLQQPSSLATTTTSSLTSSLPTLLLMRGTHFTTLSHTLRSPPSPVSNDGAPPSRPSTVLLPEEALHLLSRGSLALYASPAPAPTLDLSPQAPTIEHQLFAPEHAARKLTVQEAAALWAAEVGGGRWEVYVGLKRMGYVVQRAPKFLPKELHPATGGRTGLGAAPQSNGSWLGAAWASLRGALGHLWTAWSGVVSSVSRLLGGLLPSLAASTLTSSRARPTSNANAKEWSTLLSQRSILPDKKWSYTRIFSRLRIIPNSATPSAVSTVVASSSNKPSTGPAPVDIYFHVWKPASNYKKSSPPPPDFYVSVVDARESPLPSLGELMAMLDQTPDLPEPPARGAPAVAVPVTASSSLPPSAAADRSWRSFLPFSSFAESSSTGSTSSPVDEENVPPRGAGRNPMPYLKQGDRNVVVAVVKDGGVSWMRFGRGVFGQMAIQ